MKYYCIGIKGAGMSTLANILSDLGYLVSGYDDDKHFKYTENGLKERNIKIYYDNSFVPDKDTIVTYSKAFSMEHPEIKRLKNLGVIFKEYNQVVGDLTKMFDTISICGTHGKTTISLLVSQILSSLGINYFVGDGSGYAKKDNKYFVIESDEYNKHFLAYHPNTVVLSSLEMDHPESFDFNLEELKETFKTFVNKGKNRICCGDYQNIRDLQLSNVIYYGLKDNNDIQAKNIKYLDNGTEFDYYAYGQYIASFKTNHYGEYMVLNCLAAIYLALKYGISINIIQDVLLNFKGAKRRFVYQKLEDFDIITDYAHHPTAIRLCIDAAKQMFPNKKIIAVFLPNSYARLEVLKDEFIDSFDKADKAYILKVRSNRENASDYPNIDSDLIIKSSTKFNTIDIDDPSPLLEEKDSVILFMSCADIYLLEEKFKERILNDKGER